MFLALSLGVRPRLIHAQAEDRLLRVFTHATAWLPVLAILSPLILVKTFFILMIII